MKKTPQQDGKQTRAQKQPMAGTSGAKHVLIKSAKQAGAQK